MRLLLRLDADGRFKNVAHAEPDLAALGGGDAIPKSTSSRGDPDDLVIRQLSRERVVLSEHVVPNRRWLHFDCPTSGGDLSGAIVADKRDVAWVQLPELPNVASLTFGSWGADPDAPRALTEIPFDHVRRTRRPRRRFKTEQLHAPADPARRFQIVIVGDGFQREEMPMFRDLARVVTTRLLALPPFDSVRELIRVDAVYVPSRDSGITDCPRPKVPKSTALRMRGNFANRGYAGFCGSFQPELTIDAASSVCPTGYIDLTLVLLNTALYGGRGDRPARTAYANTVGDDRQLVDLVAHEAAHAICELTDEYVTDEAPPSDLVLPRNMASEAQRLAGDVWWFALTHEHERVDGRFRAVHHADDPIHAYTRKPIMTDAELVEMLGLFAGCSYVQKSETGARLPNEGHFYRPMVRCKMRKLSDPFCRVCAHELRRTITQTAEEAAYLRPPLAARRRS